MKSTDGYSTTTHRTVISFRILLLLVVLVTACFRVTTNPLLAWDSTLGENDCNDIHAFSDLPDHCADVPPIQANEFEQRQNNLAKALHDLNASAYITEPGASGIYFANVSSTQWHLSERPLLFVFIPEAAGKESVRMKLTILAPKFEQTRAKLLPVPFDNIEYIVWPEEQSPYEVLINATNLSEGNIYVDAGTRYFIVDGLQKAYKNGEVSIAPSEVAELRERKSANEIALMKCANEQSVDSFKATLLALRGVHKKMHVGMRESEARNMMASALEAVGLEEGSCLTLFGENAALPHGSGTDKVLSKYSFALFDCTGSLHGYKSDLTRTVALPDSEIRTEHLVIWHRVRNAQNAALAQAREGAVAKTVDEIARKSLSILELDQYFTHRLGHGIGLEVHETPYLNGGSEVVLETGHCFSDEPGVYIEEQVTQVRQVGVRLEDCFCIGENGKAFLLTQDVGGQASDPWNP
ncbi:hypothetical protein V5O48_001246 [Marasmius crinis-equi]|uniref:Peptidase M24 domain-containing protein n=1 Tax=Marasmius crinis-equi TaxID=585013 RepID=A0ABR3FYZ8_9AGAR